jgi:hypothetical protein
MTYPVAAPDSARRTPSKLWRLPVGVNTGFDVTAWLLLTARCRHPPIACGCAGANDRRRVVRPNDGAPHQ